MNLKNAMLRTTPTQRHQNCGRGQGSGIGTNTSSMLSPPMGKSRWLLGKLGMVLLLGMGLAGATWR
jgi:hypothetical protein